MKFLLDTNVLSDVRHPKGDPAVKARVGRLESANIFTSCIVLSELVRGVARLDDGTRKRELADWLTTLSNQFADRILPVDAAVATRWGRIVAKCEESGFKPGAADGLIGATTLEHGMILVTRNVRDFQPMAVEMWSPWERGL